MASLEFPRAWRSAIDSLLLSIHAEGRHVLFEHEVYRVLEIMGIRMPAHRKVKDAAEVTPDLLKAFKAPSLMVKVVSPAIHHKARAGGIAKAARTPEAVSSAIETIRAEVVQRAAPADPPPIEGFLLTDFVDYSMELGNELLIAVRENLAFGPVVCVSKGGRDAEHFAKYYSPPNIMLAPMDIGECRLLLESTRIILRYIEDGRFDLIQKLTETFYKFSLLGTHYSSFSRLDNRFVISELEVNPFVFDASGSLVALDGLGSFMERDRRLARDTEPNTRNLEAFFEPCGVAVAGVSAAEPEKLGNIIALLLRAAGRTDLYALNPKGGRVKLGDAELPLYRSLTAVDGNVDLVIVTVPAAATLDVVADAAAKGVKAMILIPGGFSEVSGATAVEERMLEIAGMKGIRLLGPNCVGVFYNPPAGTPGINCVFVPSRKLAVSPAKERVRNVALITQSGGLGVTLLDKLRYAICPRVVVSFGNQIDVDAGDLAAYFDRDPHIDAIAFYIEGFKAGGGREFFNAVKGIRKPIIIYKAGRTDAGSRAAASHTASMAGDYEIAKAAFQQAGLIIADSLLDFSDSVKTFALLSGKRVRGRTVAGVVNAGFESTYAADSLGNLTVAGFSAATVAQLKKILPPLAGINPFIDLTPMGDDVLFERCIQILLEDEGVDSLLISMVPHTVALHTTAEEIQKDADNVANRILRQYHSHDKPIVVSILAGDLYSTLVHVLEGGGVPTYATAERAMRSLDQFVSYRLRTPM